MLYLSGGGNLIKGTCGGNFLHEIIINDTTMYQPKVVDVFRMHLVSSSPKHSVSDYAAILISLNGSMFYLTHGGISCDYHKIYSDVFVIDINTKKYFKIGQNIPIA